MTTETIAKTETNRLHAFDNLRAVLALLGIPFHAMFFIGVIAYASTMSHTVSLNPASIPVILLHHLPVGLSLLFYLHVFRMPAFFLLAGFFAKSTHQSKGTITLLHNRALRIGLPFLVFMIWLSILFLLSVYSKHLIQHHSFFTVLKHLWKNGKLTGDYFNLNNIWFIYYLLYFLIVTLLYLPIHERIPVHFKRKLSMGIRLEKYLNSAWIYFFIIAFCVVLYYISGFWYTRLDQNIIPSFTLLIFYGLWYWIGWQFRAHQHVIIRYRDFAVLNSLISVGSYLIFYVLFTHYLNTPHIAIHLVMLICNLVSATFGVFGLLGLSARYLSKRNHLGRYLSRASYTIYLVQVFYIYYLSAIFHGLISSMYLQFIFVTIGGIFLSVLTFELFVKRTWLGRIL